jgi:hypothetical protein
MLIAFPLQQWLYKRVSVLRYSVLPVLLCGSVTASGTHLMSFSTMFLIPSTVRFCPAMSKPASLARTSVTCSGSSTGMWYFFKPANSNCHDDRSELKEPLLIHGSGLCSTPSCLRLSFSNNWSYFTKFGTHVITLEVNPTTVQWSLEVRELRCKGYRTFVITLSNSRFFDLSWLISTKLNETSPLTAWPPLLSCCCASHSQRSQAVSLSKCYWLLPCFVEWQ